MADNFESGTNTFRADDVGGLLYQFVKLDVGGDGVAIPVEGDSTLRAIPVVTRRKLVQTTVALTTTAGAYAADEGVGGLLTFTGMARSSGGSGQVINAMMHDLDGVGGLSYTLYLFNLNPTSSTVTNNDPVVLDAADLPALQGAIYFDSPGGGPLGPVGVSFDLDAGVPYLTSGGTSLYGVLSDNTGVTLTSTAGLSITLTAELD